MDKLLEITKEPAFSIALLCGFVVLFILEIIHFSKTNKMIKKYKNFISKFSKGNNIESMLVEYADSVDKVRKENIEIRSQIDKMEKNAMHYIQKVGIVRYNAFSDTGSDLCFALALLDFEDNGVVINGVYSRDNTTTTYAKPVEKGISKYTLSQEEEEAIRKAKDKSSTYYININDVAR